MNYISILNEIYGNSKPNKEGKTIISEDTFHKLAEDLNTLFAKRIVSRQFKEKGNLKFEEFMNNFCKNGITLTNNYTGETIGFKELVKKYKLTNDIEP